MNVTQEARDYAPRHPVGVKRPRPMICAVCREDAEFVEVTVHKLVHIDSEAVTRYQQVPKGIYYCATHGGVLG